MKYFFKHFCGFQVILKATFSFVVQLFYTSRKLGQVNFNTYVSIPIPALCVLDQEKPQPSDQFSFVKWTVAAEVQCRLYITLPTKAQRLLRFTYSWTFRVKYRGFGGFSVNKSILPIWNSMTDSFYVFERIGVYANDFVSMIKISGRKLQ